MDKSSLTDNELWITACSHISFCFAVPASPTSSCLHAFEVRRFNTSKTKFHA